MFSIASLYDKHHSLQEQDTIEFLSSVVSKMNWSMESEDLVMDVGCGPGDSTCHKLLPSIPNVCTIIGIDLVPSMIEYANTNNAHQKIEYYVANIEDKSTIKQWMGQITKIISIYCLHWLKCQREGFQNIYDLLKPGGEAALLVEMDSAFWNCYDELVNNSKWNKFLKNVDQGIPESFQMANRSSHYRMMLQDIGFQVIMLEEQRRIFAYKDDAECKNSVASISALMTHIPNELKEEFKRDLFQGFLKYNPRGPDGRPNLYHITMTFLLKKPKEV